MPLPMEGRSSLFRRATGRAISNMYFGRRGKMKRATALAAVAFLAFSATTVIAGTLYWNFEDGMQGWTFAGPGAGAARWVAPGSTIMLPDYGQSAPGGNLYLPDRSVVLYDIPDTKSFILQAKVYIPNLRPIHFPGWDYPSNMIHQAGIQAYRADGKAVCLEGKYDTAALRYRDYTWDNVWHNFDWVFEDRNKIDYNQWYDNWIILKMDYNYPTPGIATFSAYIPWNSWVHSAGWISLGPAIVTNDQVFTTISLGGYYSWTQAQFDEVIFESPDVIVASAVPEPASGVVLAGMVVLLGIFRRRK